MFNNANLQLVGGTPRRDVLPGVLDALDDEDAPGGMAVVRPVSFKSGSTPVLPVNVSSEQRSLLNCILNLSKLLAENAGNGLSPKQVDYAQTIYTAGTQLLAYLDHQVLDDLAGEAQFAFSTVTETYHGPRSRRSDDGFVLNAKSDSSASSGRRPSMPELTGKKVLIVDDDILNIYAMTSALEQQGMIVMHADSALDGLEKLRTQKDMDAVIVNGGIRALDKNELTDVIRGIRSFRSIPIIVVTPANAQGSLGMCTETGASDTIDKPINIEQLLSLMRAWLTRA